MKRLLFLAAVLGGLALFGLGATGALAAPSDGHGGSGHAGGGHPGQQAPAVFSDDDLQAALKSMGLDPKETKEPVGRAFEITMIRGDAKYVVKVRISNHHVLMHLRMPDLTPQELGDASVFVRMLEKSANMYSKVEIWYTNQPMLTRTFDNRAVTSAVIQEEVDGLLADYWTVHQARINAPATPKTDPAPRPKTEPPAKTEAAPLYKSEAGRFSIRMPVQPTTSEEPNGAHVIRCRIEKEGTEYVACYGDIPEQTPRTMTVDKQLDEACDSMVTLTKGKLIDKKSITVAGFPAREITVEANNMTITVRFLVADNRSFMIGIAQPTASFNREAAQQYLDSFQLIR